MFSLTEPTAKALCTPLFLENCRLLDRVSPPSLFPFLSYSQRLSVSPVFPPLPAGVLRILYPSVRFPPPPAPPSLKFIFFNFPLFSYKTAFFCPLFFAPTHYEDKCPLFLFFLHVSFPFFPNCLFFSGYSPNPPTINHNEIFLFDFACRLLETTLPRSFLPSPDLTRLIFVPG